VPISKQKKLNIERQANKSAESLTNKKKEDFITAEIAIQTELNVGIDDVLATYRQEIAPFILGDLPFLPHKTNETIETTALEIKMILEKVLISLQPINNAAIKVLMLDSIHKGLKVVQKASINKDILIKRVLGGKED
jgi:hypothetical protein